MTGRTRVWLGLGAVALAAAAAVATHYVLLTRQSSLPPAPVTRVPASWKDFRQGEGHVVHVQQVGIACAKCHGEGKTMAKPSLTVCAGCHEQRARMRHGLGSALDLGAAHGAELADCLGCHGFAADAVASPWQCLSCHEEPQGTHVAIAHGGHDDCSACHRPHDEPSIQPKACRDCHVGADNQHGGMSAEGGKNCLACHDAHGSPTLANERCSGCHDKPEATFVGHDRCAGCHVPHEFSADDVASCTSCHRERHTLAETEVAAHARCTSCHDPHAPKRASDATCQGCHTKVAPSHPVVEGHACVSCHAPHAQHAPLAMVAPHAIGMPTAHTAAVPTHAACTQCHALAHDDGSAHGGKAECTTCHVPHAFAHPAQPGVCADCHRVQLSAIASNPGHAGRKPRAGTAAVTTGGKKSPCLSCHQGHPHDASLPPVACSTCHADPHPRQGHQECTSCHEPHSGTPLALSQSCETCHAAQRAAALPEHRACLRCHTPHEGGSLAPASCRGCHAKQAATQHGQLDAGCGECHGIHPQGSAAHGSGGSVSTVATCTKCHAPSTLGGLHQVKEHQTCTKCHGGAHDAGPFSERATCVACHSTREKHVPEAALCQGCHVFKP